MRSEEVIGLLREAVQDRQPLVRIGTIPGSYSSGRPTIQFDGEGSPSTKTYPYLASYAPAANDRVLLLKAGSAWVVVGSIV